MQTTEGTLSFDRDYTHTELLIGAIHCVAPSVTHDDGTVEPLTIAAADATFDISDTSIVRIGDASDCADGAPGIVGLAPGSTQVTLHVGGRSARVTITVLDARVALAWSGGATSRVPVGQRLPLFGVIRAAASLPASPEPVGCRCGVPESWLGFESSQPATLRVDGQGQDAGVVGVAEGTAMLTPAIGPPGEPSVVLGTTSFTMTVVPVVAPDAGNAELRVLAWDGPQRGQPTSSVDGDGCVLARKWDSYTNPSDGWVYGFPAESATYTSSGASLALMSGTSDIFCGVSGGTATLTGCDANGCATSATITVTTDTVVSFTVDLQSTTPVQVMRGDGSVCLPVRLRAQLASGASSDITLDHNVSWGYVLHGGMDEESTPTNLATIESNVDGDPCLRIGTPPIDTFTTRDIDADWIIGYPNLFIQRVHIPIQVQ